MKEKYLHLHHLDVYSLYTNINLRIILMLENCSVLKNSDWIPKILMPLDFLFIFILQT